MGDQREVAGAGRGAQMHLHVIVATCVERVIRRNRRDEKACRVTQGGVGVRVREGRCGLRVRSRVLAEGIKVGKWLGAS